MTARCIVKSCRRKRTLRQFCRNHYTQWRDGYIDDAGKHCIFELVCKICAKKFFCKRHKKICSLRCRRKANNLLRKKFLAKNPGYAKRQYHKNLKRNRLLTYVRVRRFRDKQRGDA